MKFTQVMLVSALILGIVASGAYAFPVAGWGKGGFGDFAKAIVFTSNSPANAETIATAGATVSNAIPMRPVGDGSWVCTATIIAGSQYSYYFQYRIPKFDSTTVYTDSRLTYAWRNVSADARTGDVDRTRTITVPATATSGYVFYNMFGDNDVKGAQGSWSPGDSWLTTANDSLTTYQGRDTVSSTGNGDTTDAGASMPYNVTVLQTGETAVKISWDFSYGGDGFSPTIEGEREFDTGASQTQYGFKILRARVPAAYWSSDTTNYKVLVFEDTVIQQVHGDSLWSPHRDSQSIGWYSSSYYFTDTAMAASPAGDTCIYAVVWQDAYGNISDSSSSSGSGFAKKWVRGVNVNVFFLVENFDPNYVFPNGATTGRLRVTPWADGVPYPADAFWVYASLPARKS